EFRRVLFRSAVMPQLFTEAMRGTAIEIFVQQHPRPDRYSQRAFRDHTRRGRALVGLERPAWSGPTDFSLLVPYKRWLRSRTVASSASTCAFRAASRLRDCSYCARQYLACHVISILACFVRPTLC